MSRSKKKKSTSASQRKQEAIQKRMGRAAENAEKRKSKMPAEPEKPKAEPGQVPEPAARPDRPAAKEPVTKPSPRRSRPSRPRYEAPMPSMKKALSVRDDGSVGFPSRMGLSDLFKAIRNDDPSGESTLYIKLDGQDASKSNYDLSYKYLKGLFTRNEALGSKNGKNQPPVLADLLDARVKTLRYDGADWYAGAIAPTAGDEAGE